MDKMPSARHQPGQAIGVRLSPLRCGRSFGQMNIEMPAIAVPLAPDKVPEPLKAWTNWVLRGHETQRCPFLFDQPKSAADARYCVWPSRLELELGDKSGRFTQRWRIFARARVPLPGKWDRWPLDVQVDGRPAAVIGKAGRPPPRLGSVCRVSRGPP